MKVPAGLRRRTVADGSCPQVPSGGWEKWVTSGSGRDVWCLWTCLNIHWVFILSEKLLFRGWSVLSALLYWPPSYLWAFSENSLRCVAICIVSLDILRIFASQSERSYCCRLPLLRFVPVSKHGIVMQTGKEAWSKVRSLVISYAALPEGILMKMVWFRQLVMS